MKRVLSVIVVTCFLFTMVGCGSNKNIPIKDKEGKYRTYTFQQVGLFNQEKKNPQVEYSVIVGNVIWAVILCETVIAPVVIFGWYLYEPIGTSVEGVPGAVEPPQHAVEDR